MGSYSGRYGCSAAAIWCTGSGLVGLKQLKMLRLDHNLLRCVTPPELDTCSKLTHLDLSHNYLTCVDGLGCMRDLEELNLSSNQLTSLAEVARCSKVRGRMIAYVWLIDLQSPPAART